MLRIPARADRLAWRLCRVGHASSDFYPSFNVHSGAIVKGAKFGVVTGGGEKNLYSGLLYDSTGALSSTPEGVRFLGSDSHVDIMTAGTAPGTVGLRYNGEAINNSASIYAHHDTNTIVTLVAGAKGNFTDVVHPGHRASLLGSSVLSGRANIYSASPGEGNPIHCSATGEWLGSLSNTFKWYLADTPSVSRGTIDHFCFVPPAEVDSRLTIFGNAGGSTSFTLRTPTYTASLQLADTSGQLRLIPQNSQNYYAFTQDRISPSLDNVASIGSGGNRLKEVFAATNVINTSDQREKQDIAPIADDVLDAWADVSLVAYRWVESVREKGAGARIHSGVIAQQVRDAFEAKGLDATRYGLLCYDQWEAQEEELDDEGNISTPARDAGDRWGIRADQCLFVEAAYQRRRLDRLEARLAALEPSGS